MTVDNISDTKRLETQIRQLREAIAVLENREKAAPGIEPEELSRVMFQKMDDTDPVHPRLREILNNHVDIDQVKRSVKRLENDLNDLKNIQNPEELYDPFEHEMDGEPEQGYSEPAPQQERNETEIDDNPAELRDENQRPLSAYSYVPEDE